jgi:hypothetical protein
MATYQQGQYNSYGYPQNNPDSSYPQSSSSSNQNNQQYRFPQQPQQAHQPQHPQQQHQQHQQQHQSHASNNYYSSGPENGYYGFADAHNQQNNQYYLQPNTQSQGMNGHNNGNGNMYGNPSINGLQDYYTQNVDYDPFALGVLTGPGMYFNPSLLQYPQQQQQQQPYYPQQKQELEPVATTSHLHRPNTVSPTGSLPGSVQSSHRNLHSVTPDRARTPDGEDGNASPQPTSALGPVRAPMGRNREGPVKAACLSCRQKKAKCDGVKPICTQVCHFGSAELL